MRKTTPKIKKLQVSSETLRNLTQPDLEGVRGGQGLTHSFCQQGAEGTGFITCGSVLNCGAA